MSHGPADRQVQIMRALRCAALCRTALRMRIAARGPSVRQLGGLVGLSGTGPVAYRLGRLEKRDLISRSDRRW